jgi:hypothetical protein
VKKNISQKNDKGNQFNKIIQEEFSGKNLTRFGGSGLIRRFIKRHRIKEQIENRVKVAGRRKSKYSVGNMLIGFIYAMFLGYPRPGQMGVLSTDSVFHVLAGLIAFPVQSTISRFLSSLKVIVGEQIADLNFDFLMKFRKGFKTFKIITLDLDSHVTPVYGNQQRAGLGYNPKKKGRKSYHPLLCFLGETRDYLGGLFRSGKHHSSYHAVRFLKAVINKLPCHIEKIRLRADSGFFSGNIIRYLVKKHVEFYIVVPMQPWVQKKIKHLKQWQSIGWGIATGQCGYVFEKDASLRMVIVRQRVKKGNAPQKQLKLLHSDDLIYDYQVILTNSDKEAKEVWRFYNKRACCENFIKEGIYGFGLDKVISHSYAGNYAWFELLMFAYNLMNFFKEEVLKQNKVKNMIQVIRDRLFFIPGRLISTGRKYVLKLEQTWFYRKEYEEALARLS